MAVVKTQITLKVTQMSKFERLTLNRNMVLNLLWLIIIIVSLSNIATVTASTLITTVAGNGSTNYIGENIKATSSTLNSPTSVWCDENSNFYIADLLSYRISRVDAVTNMMTNVAGIPNTNSFSGDGGKATSATIGNIGQIFGGSVSLLYVVDNSNRRIRVINLIQGTIMTVAGGGISSSFSYYDKATSCVLDYPQGIWVNTISNMYISLYSTSVIRKVDSITGNIYTIAGVSGGSGFGGDGGKATAATLNHPYQLFGDSVNSKLYIADTQNNRIRTISLITTMITTFAGTGGTSSTNVANIATSMSLSNPYAVTGDTNGVIYISDSHNDKVKMVTTSGIMSTIVGFDTVLVHSATSQNGDYGSATAAILHDPYGLFVTTIGDLYLADNGHNKIRKVYEAVPTQSPTQFPFYSIQMHITTAVGTGVSGTNSVPIKATAATLVNVQGIWTDSVGNLYICDHDAPSIYKLDAVTNLITPFVGTPGATGYGGDDGKATAALMGSGGQVFIDSSSVLYFCCMNHAAVRQVNLVTNIITLTAGRGEVYSAYGPATSSSLNGPMGVFADLRGNVYISEVNLQIIRKVTYMLKYMFTIAGISGTSSAVGASPLGLIGDGGKATAATLYQPHRLHGDSSGMAIYVADAGNNKVRALSLTTATISSFAGSGESLTTDIVSHATSTSISAPVAVFITTTNTMYICDRNGNKLKMITPTGYCSTMIGIVESNNTPTALNGDGGSPTAATLWSPNGVVVDKFGVMFIAERQNRKIRKVYEIQPTQVPTSAPFQTVQPSQSSSFTHISTIAGKGGGNFDGDGIKASSSNLMNPSGVWVDAMGNVYIADTENCRIRKVSIGSGLISTVVGSNSRSASALDSNGDGGRATSVTLSTPRALFGDIYETIYFCDRGNNKLRAYSISLETVYLVAGTGGTATSVADGTPATSAVLNGMHGVWVDSSGNIYFSTFTHFIYKIAVESSKITVIAGKGIADSNGDGIKATAASLDLPHCIHSANSMLYLADNGGCNIRKINLLTGIINHVAGTGSCTSTNTVAAATSTSVDKPVGVWVDANEVVYASEYTTAASRIKLISQTGIMSTIVGNIPAVANAPSSANGDGGPPTSASLNNPRGIALDSVGSLYVADDANNKIRKVFEYLPTITPTKFPTVIRQNTYTQIGTVAGTGTASYNNNGIKATTAHLNNPTSVWVDSVGNMYITDTSNFITRKVTATTELISVIIGTGAPTTSSTALNGDGGPATSALLGASQCLHGDSYGILYICDSTNKKIRVYNAFTETIALFAGSGATPTTENVGVVATSANLNTMQGLWVDAAGNVFVSNSGGNNVWKIDTYTNLLVAIVGTGAASDNGASVLNQIGDGGSATSATLSTPLNLFLDLDSLYFTDFVNEKVRKVDIVSGIISLVAGTGTAASTNNVGRASATSLYSPIGILVDANGIIYTNESPTNTGKVKQITKDGLMTTIVGHTPAVANSPTNPNGDGGPPTAASLSGARTLVCDTLGSMYIAERYNHKIRKLFEFMPTTAPTAVPSIRSNSLIEITTTAGTGNTMYNNENIPATSANLNGPHTVWSDSLGNLFISDTYHFRIRIIDVSTSLITSVVGTGTASGSTDSVNNLIGDGGYATSATLQNVKAMFGDAYGNLYLADKENNKIRVFSSITLLISLVAGTGATPVVPVDGIAATAAILNNPEGVWVDPAGNVFVSDTLNFKILRIDTYSYLLTTIAGTGIASAPTASTSAAIGDGGMATSATLFNPKGIFLNPESRLSSVLYVTDNANSKIRAVNLAAGKINFVAGNGILDSVQSSGVATSLPINTVLNICTDVNGDLYAAEYGSNLIKKVSTDGFMSTLVGSGDIGFPTSTNGDGGPPIVAQLNGPRGITIDFVGSIYVSELNNHKVRKIYEFSPTSQPSVQPSSKPSVQPTNQPTGQPVVSPSHQPTDQPSSQPSCQPRSYPSTWPSSQPSNHPSKQPSSKPSRVPTLQPSIQPSSIPSKQPSSLPTLMPSCQPSNIPSGQPAIQPSKRPSSQPVCIPSSQPSHVPSNQPSGFPSSQPSYRPFGQPTHRPTHQPSAQPQCAPSSSPSSQPSSQPTYQPIGDPTSLPSAQPNIPPSVQPTQQPLIQPTVAPSSHPSSFPSKQPSMHPSKQPFARPSWQPLSMPSEEPYAHPSSQPSSFPSGQPSLFPSTQLILTPTFQPSTDLSGSPSCQSRRNPSGQLSSAPSLQPSIESSFRRSCQPTCTPSQAPTVQPSSNPSTQPTTSSSTHSTSMPTSLPSIQPYGLPTCRPTEQPNVVPTRQPSEQPSSSPSVHPSKQPSIQPSKQPSIQPSSHPSPYPVAIGTSRLPTVVTVDPSFRPTRMQAISVVFEINVTEFKIVLPFMFTNPVRGDGKFNVYIPPPNTARGLLVYGEGHESQVNLVGSKTLQILPVISRDYSGRSVSIAGDVNGDGVDDLIIGVPYASVCYVLFGTLQGFVNMTEGFTIHGSSSSDLTGWSVSGAGDVNNDTVADIIIGAPSAGTSQGGAVYVLYGGEHPQDIELSELSAENGFILYGADEQDSLGISVSGAGDANGDGCVDIVIGALRTSDFFSGGAYIIFGARLRDNHVIAAKTMLPKTGYIVEGPPWSWFGYSVSGAGDVNGDGIADVIIGSVPRRIYVGIPVSYVLFGRTNGSFLKIVDGVEISGGGAVVSGVGDVNGDGFDDVLLVGGVDFSDGGGIVLSIPNQFPKWTVQPTFKPSGPPTIRPSIVPSVIPTLRPTRPTVAPSVAPTGPTMLPTERPSQPTSQPSASPTAPSFPPSMEPSHSPSYVSTTVPTIVPVMSPSVSPSVVPSTMKTMSPTLVQTLLPTRFPVVRPTMMPSNFSEPPVRNITYNVIYLKQGGLYARSRNNTHYIVNSTSDVTIGEVGGIVLFTVIPNQNTTLRIMHFDVSTDVIDLKAFKDIHSINQLMHTIDSRMLITSNANYSIELALGRSQYILIANISVYDLKDDNFHFSEEQRIPAIGRMKKSYGPLIVLCTVFGSLGLLLIYKFGEQLLDYFHIKRLKAKVTDWDSDNVRENPTYISFNINDSDRSIFSDISKESEDDSSDVTSESKESTVYESPRHSAVGESKSDSDISICSHLSSHSSNLRTSHRGNEIMEGTLPAHYDGMYQSNQWAYEDQRHVLNQSHQQQLCPFQQQYYQPVNEQQQDNIDNAHLAHQSHELFRDQDQLWIGHIPQRDYDEEWGLY